MESRFDNYFITALPRQRLTFAYDGRGRRIEKRVYDWNYTTTTFQLTTTTKFAYDTGWNLLAERESTQPSWRTYLWGGDLSGTLVGAGGVGGLLVENDPSQGALVSAYDGNDNIKSLLKVGDGTIGATYEYGPFGEPLRATGPMAKANPFRFSTHYTDEETGLVYAKRRYYWPAAGRWISRDAIGERGGANLNAAFLNNPISNFDPNGNEVITAVPPGYTAEFGRLLRERFQAYVKNIQNEKTKQSSRHSQIFSGKGRCAT